MPDTALSQPAASSLSPVLKDGRAPQLLEAAAASALVASYGAVSKGAALKDIEVGLIGTRSRVNSRVRCG